MTSEHERSARLANRLDIGVMYVEMAIYVVVSALLVLGALALLGSSIQTFVEDLDRGTVYASTRMLSLMLLVFVFVELLGAVRSTIRERELVAEPFLLVGIIASIKEIVLIAGTEREGVPDSVLHHSLMQVGVLSLTVLALAIATLLLRRRPPELDPEPASMSPSTSDPEQSARRE